MIKAANIISSQVSTPPLPSDLHLHPPHRTPILPTSLSDPGIREEVRDRRRAESFLG